MLEEKNELIKTERELIDIEKKSEINLDVAKQELKDKQDKNLIAFLKKGWDHLTLKVKRKC